MQRVRVIGISLLVGLISEARGSTSQKLQSILIPSMEVVEAPIEDVAKFLQSKSAELDVSGIGVNIIIDASPETLEKTATLQLRQVTLGRAIWFLAEVAGLDLKVDRHAVMLVERTGKSKQRGQPESAPELVLKLRTIQIPSIEFQETPFDDALQFLRNLAIKNDPEPNAEKKGINIVKIPQQGVEDRSVTMRLSGVPLGEAIKYTCGLANYSVTIQKGAVVVYPTPVPRTGDQ
ncbi:MAG: hypothetical protein MI807_08230 [Verrucomicrobiales bacterium]|nr:hypothetical protein [Verrucomicrobiales bacterium]